VGSEMCIRDSRMAGHGRKSHEDAGAIAAAGQAQSQHQSTAVMGSESRDRVRVSYGVTVRGSEKPE